VRTWNLTLSDLILVDQANKIVNSVQSQCTVYRVSVQCTESVYSVQSQCTVYRVSVQCTESVYSVQSQCTVYRVSVQCTESVYSALNLLCYAVPHNSCYRLSLLLENIRIYVMDSVFCSGTILFYLFKNYRKNAWYFSKICDLTALQHVPVLGHTRFLTVLLIVRHFKTLVRGLVLWLKIHTRFS
jgi:hypothetical protein